MIYDLLNQKKILNQLLSAKYYYSSQQPTKNLIFFLHNTNLQQHFLLLCMQI